jgi:hypothetical protein
MKDFDVHKAKSFAEYCIKVNSGVEELVKEIMSKLDVIDFDEYGKSDNKLDYLADAIMKSFDLSPLWRDFFIRHKAEVVDKVMRLIAENNDLNIT